MTVFQGVESAAKKLKHENGSERNRGETSLEPRGQGGLPSRDTELDLNNRMEAEERAGQAEVTARVQGQDGV